MWQQIRSNQRKTVALVLLMAGFLLALGFFLGEFLLHGSGLIGLLVAFALWLILTLIAFSAGDSVFLALGGARKIQKRDHPVLFNVVEEMTIAAGLPKVPDVYIMDQASPNAFATGRNPQKAAVAVTSGLLEILDRDELQGVIAHELGHIKNRDVLYMMMVGIMLGTIVLLADIGLRSVIYSSRGRRRTSKSGGGQAEVLVLIIAVALMVLAPLLAQLIYFTISRKREYLADASGAQFSRYPEGLARALEKISGQPQKLTRVSRVTAPSYIINPLRQASGRGSNWFSTHPSVSERVKILRSMGGLVDAGAYDQAFRKVTGRPVGLMPAGSLAAAEAEAQKARSPSKQAESSLQRLRQTTDLLWKLNQFAFISCACGTKLKFPPAYHGKTLPCPHCQRQHRVVAPSA